MRSLVLIACLLSLVLCDYQLVFKNNCGATISIGAQNIPGFSPQKLAHGATYTLDTPTNWATGGTVWGCYPNNTKCNTNAPEPPVSVIELMCSSSAVWYDISYVSGYNVPVGIIPSNGCTNLTCGAFNLNGVPSELIWDENSQLVGVWSVCKACWDSNRSSWFKQAWGSNYNDWSQLVCCSGPYATKDACDPTSKWPLASNGRNYVDVMDSECHDAYSYPYDDQKALIECIAPTYQLLFCP